MNWCVNPYSRKYMVLLAHRTRWPNQEGCPSGCFTELQSVSTVEILILEFGCYTWDGFYIMLSWKWALVWYDDLSMWQRHCLVQYSRGSCVKHYITAWELFFDAVKVKSRRRQQRCLLTPWLPWVIWFGLWVVIFFISNFFLPIWPIRLLGWNCPFYRTFCKVGPTVCVGSVQVSVLRRRLTCISVIFPTHYISVGYYIGIWTVI